ncbi:MAG: hypothetical protein P8100_11425 [bacterium]|jgi:hypothetical protein
MKRKPTYVPVILLILSLFILNSCAPGNVRFEEDTAGFWMGLWHGFISFFTFVISLFSDNVTIYELNNNGGWYNFGFIMGISVFYGGGSKGCCR